MNAQISLQWTEDLLVRAQERFLSSLHISRRWWYWITLGMTFTLFLVSVVFRPAYYVTWLLAALVALSLALLFLLPWLRRRGIRAGFRKFGEYTQTYIIADDALQVKHPYAQGAVPWSKFEKLCRFDDMWLLFVTKAAYYILPVDEMKGEVGEFIIGKVRENGGKVK